MNVNSTLGDIPEEDVMFSLDQKDQGASWSVTREGVYIGSAHPEAHGSVVRRDVWVTFKCGQAASAATGGVDHGG